jgi:uncharacterized membrane protein
LLLLACVPIPLLCSVAVLWTRTVRDAPRDAGGRALLSLNGARHLPLADREAVRWLNARARPGDSVLEAVQDTPEGWPGGDYTEFARVSALTGVPTPLGWCGPSHVPAWAGADTDKTYEELRRVWIW